MAPSILVVEDHPDTALAICTLLELEGYRADGAGSGREALEKVRQNGYDVVILDLVLPDISGYDVAHALKERHEGVTVIAVSAKDTVDSSQFDDYLPKPFSTEDLLAKIRQHLPH